MDQPNALTDPRALARNRARADAAALFLQDAARDELQDRVGMVNKPFRSAAVVTGFPQVWAQGDVTLVPEAEVLDLAPQTHDLVMHSLGLHWANDPVGQLIQCRRALKPDGLLLAASLGGQSLHELRACLAEAEIAVTGGLSP
ncbi:MAG: methyltransferase domain-containing protein, partial [Pseudomonadota bacterium]